MHWCLVTTRTTRTPGFWGYPKPPHDYPYYWAVHFGSQVKTRQSYKFKEFVKTLNFLILKKKTLHATHLLKLLDKECKNEMDPASIVEDTERTRFCPQMDRQTRWNQYTPLQLCWAGGYNKIIELLVYKCHFSNTSLGVNRKFMNMNNCNKCNKVEKLMELCFCYYWMFIIINYHYWMFDVKIGLSLSFRKMRLNVWFMMFVSIDLDILWWCIFECLNISFSMPDCLVWMID